MGGETKQFLELKNTVKDVEDIIAIFKEDSFREKKLPVSSKTGCRKLFMLRRNRNFRTHMLQRGDGKNSGEGSLGGWWEGNTERKGRRKGK